jgi:hypothetical protein
VKVASSFEFTTILKFNVSPIQPFIFGVTEIIPEVEGPFKTVPEAINEGIIPTPLAGKPIEGFELIHSKIVAGEPVICFNGILTPSHTDTLVILLVVGRGLISTETVEVFAHDNPGVT